MYDLCEVPACTGSWIQSFEVLYLNERAFVQPLPKIILQDSHTDAPNKPFKVIFDFHGRFANLENQHKNS